MSDHVVDHKNAEFMLFAKARDFRRAHKSLQSLASETSMTQASLAGWQSHLLNMEGRLDEATAILDPHIQADDISGKFLRHQRARLFLSNDQLKEAQADLEALLADDHPRVAALHSGCQVQLAYILARQGDPRFEDVLSTIPDGRDYFIKGAIVGKEELERLYRASRGQAR